MMKYNINGILVDALTVNNDQNVTAHRQPVWQLQYVVYLYSFMIVQLILNSYHLGLLGKFWPTSSPLYVWESTADLVLYCIDLVMSIIIIQIQADSVIGDTRRDTQFLKAYANHTMLENLPLPHTRPILWCYKYLLVEIKKLNRYLQWLTSTVFSKSSNSQDISSGHDVLHTPAQFPVWGFIITDDDCHILSAWV